jgi:hypothetical protein
MFAGLCGGIVNIFQFHRTKPLEWVGAIVCGAVTANFLGNLVLRFGGNDPAGLGAAFLIGWFGLRWTAGIVKKHFPGVLFEEGPDGHH